MISCHTIEQLRTQVSQWQQNGETIAFVPTMGHLHAGHLSLIDIAKKKASRVIVSIYVNPLQFAQDEDFASYPRTLDDDLVQLKSCDIDLVFLPDSTMIYPEGERLSTYVEVPELSHIIEGEFRPDFFRGVATVVLKLFNLVEPDIAVFGEKDFQQLLIIQRLVKDMCLPIEVVGGAIRREANGLAMSSRNVYLNNQEREISYLLSEALSAFKQQIEARSSVADAQAICTRTLEKQGFIVDYATLRETSCLDAVSDNELVKDKELIILAAVKLGQTRLIDNLKFTL
ncbi:Pantoate--beta-alanine ligase [hydrothermal vent metagenome]|uniref:pantoate--beta-alanine ligase (AMP-forming) n=1 Tax=hydrothermal vent metagenome TaxID=652676 RepID=A0A3B0WND0_9ZZZZ